MPTPTIRSGRSLKWLLTSLSLGLLLPTLAFVAILFWQFAASERSRVEDTARGLSRGFAVALDREFNGILTTLQALATSPSLQTHDLAAFYAQAREVSRLQGINISLRDIDGHTLLSTRAAFGEAVEVPPMLAAADREVLRTGKEMVSNVFTGTVAKKPVFQVIAAPVTEAGKPTYLLAASIDVDILTNVIRNEHLPPEWVGAVIDRNNTFVTRTEQPTEVSGATTSETFRRRTPADAGSYYGRNSRGQEVLLGYATSALSGWTTTASLSATAVNAPLRRTLWALLAVGALLGVIAVLVALTSGHRLADAFDRLTAAADAIGHGRPVEPIGTRVAEVNAVGAALFAASRQLDERAADRDRAEGALRELANTLETQVAARTRERNRLWETTNDLVGIGTFAGDLRAVNPAWFKLLGWSEAELLARPFAPLVHADDHPAMHDVIARLARGDTVTGFVDRVLTRAGLHRTIMWNAVPAPDEGLFYMVGRDLTDQLQAEAAVRQMQKMEAIGQLTGGIAHDFNNMLAVIMGALNLLQRRIARGETDVGRYVDNALEGATRAAALTQRLLAFARQQPLSPEAVDVDAMVAGMAELLTRTLGEQNRVDTVIAPGVWRAKADPSQLESVILNLAVNARDAMPDGGTLTITAANTPVGPAFAAEAGIASGPYVLIAVADTGSGMPPEVVAKAFEPFFTTKEVGKGTGLGLSQAFGFARQSGGHAAIESTPGRGTTVKLFLPRSDAEPPPTRKTPPQPVRAGSAREIVLVVEDEERVRKFASEALRDLGYTVVHAANGADALQLLAAGQDVDLLFTDIVMPGMTGRQLVDTVAADRPGLKILYTTGYSRDAIVHDGVLDPGTNLLQKPFTVDQLATAVRGVLDGVS